MARNISHAGSGQVDDVQADVGDPSTRTNFQDIEDMIGIPDAANSSLDDILRTGFDSSGISANADGSIMERAEYLADLIDAVQADLGNPSTRTNLKSIMAILDMPDATNSSLFDLLATGYDSSAITANIDGSLMERNEHIDDQIDLLAPGVHNHHLSPQALGEGAAKPMVSISTNSNDESNAAASAQWYYGEPSILIGRSVITTEYELLALNLDATTQAVIFQLDMYFGTIANTSAKNAGNAWDEAATVLSVVDGTIYATDDLVSIYSGYQVEIVRVASVSTNDVTIVRETVDAGTNNTGLRWNHTTNDAGNEKMTLVYRPSDHDTHGMNFHYSAASAKDFTHIILPFAPLLAANTFVIGRAINMTNSTNSTGFDVSVAYED